MNTRSKKELPDSVLHVYPEERKKRQAKDKNHPPVTESSERISYITDEDNNANKTTIETLVASGKPEKGEEPAVKSEYFETYKLERNIDLSEGAVGGEDTKARTPEDPRGIQSQPRDSLTLSRGREDYNIRDSFPLNDPFKLTRDLSLGTGSQEGPSRRSQLNVSDGNGGVTPASATDPALRTPLESLDSTSYYWTPDNLSNTISEFLTPLNTTCLTEETEKTERFKTVKKNLFKPEQSGNIDITLVPSQPGSPVRCSTPTIDQSHGAIPKQILISRENKKDIDKNLGFAYKREGREYPTNFNIGDTGEYSNIAGFLGDKSTFVKNYTENKEKYRPTITSPLTNKKVNILTSRKQGDNMADDPPNPIAHNQTVSLKDALGVIPFYDGQSSSLGMFIEGCKEAMEMLGEEAGRNLVKAVRCKISGEARRTIHMQSFEDMQSLFKYLKSVYAPAKSFYQLQGELGVIYQGETEPVIAYANRVRDLGTQIIEAFEFDNNREADAAFKLNTKNSLPPCFIRGLRAEIELRMPKEGDIDQIIKQAIQVERQLTAQSALRDGSRSPPDNKNNKTGSPARVRVITSDTTYCQNCKKSDHDTTTCMEKNLNAEQSRGDQGTRWKEVVCQVCNKRGHEATKCFKIFPSNENKGITDAPPLTICQICNKRGHTANNCYQLFPPETKNTNINSVICQLCKKSGHTANNCNQRPNIGPRPLMEKINQVPQGLRFNEQNNNLCQICKKFGHSGDRCPFRYNQSRNFSQSQVNNQRRYSEGNRGIIDQVRNCHYCKQPGHFIRECEARLRNEEAEQRGQGNAHGLPSMGATGEAPQNARPIRVITMGANIANPN